MIPCLLYLHFFREDSRFLGFHFYFAYNQNFQRPIYGYQLLDFQWIDYQQNRLVNVNICKWVFNEKMMGGIIIKIAENFFMSSLGGGRRYPSITSYNFRSKNSVGSSVIHGVRCLCCVWKTLFLRKKFKIKIRKFFIIIERANMKGFVFAADLSSFEKHVKKRT